MSTQSNKQFEQKLWNIANILRGKMDAYDLRNYILGFIFYKYISDKQCLYVTKTFNLGEQSKDYHQMVDKDIISNIHKESLIDLGYFIHPNDLFSNVLKLGNSYRNEGNYTSIAEKLQCVFSNIEHCTMGLKSENAFSNIFEDIDLNSTKLGTTLDSRNDFILELLSAIELFYLDLTNNEHDILGDAYEYIIGKFASDAGKLSGEFYTPRYISELLAKLVTTGKKRVSSVYDPTCGSASLLLHVGKKIGVDKYYGQEINRTIFNLARMNMIIHGVDYIDFNIRCGDTLLEPKHPNQRFEVIVAQPPFSLGWEGDSVLYNVNDSRFINNGGIAPKNKADLAFVQHMIYHLSNDGVVACVLPLGVLFRGGAEAVIRKYLIKELNCLDAVIGLPANTLYGTSISACILVLKKQRESTAGILFIDASNDYEKEEKRNALTYSSIDKIIYSYNQRINVVQYSHLATLNEIEENDFNLNIKRYLFQKKDDNLGYKTRKLSDILRPIKKQNAAREVINKMRAKVVKYSSLKTDIVNYQLSTKELSKDIVRERFYKITESSILLSMRFGEIRPTYLPVNPQDNIYSTPDIKAFALRKTQDIKNIDYLIYALNSESTKKYIEAFSLGSNIKYLNYSDLMNLEIAIPALSQQDKILKAVKQTHLESIIRENELEKYIEDKKQEFIEELRIKRHTLSQYVTNLQASISVLSILLNSKEGILKADEIISKSADITLKQHILNMRASADKIGRLTRDLTNSTEFHKAENINLDCFLSEYIQKYPLDKLFHFEYIKDELSLQEESYEDEIQPIISISPIELANALEDIISNAKIHGFTDNNKQYIIRVTLSFESSSGKLIVAIENNGNSFPDGMDTKRYSTKHEIAGRTGQSGLGGFNSSRIIEHYGGNLTIDRNDSSDFPVIITLRFPLMKY